MDQEKIKSIVDMPAPSNPKEVQIYLGLINYYRRYIRDCSKICAPLNNLLKTSIQFVFNQECVDAFNKTKSALISYPILRHADETKPYLLYCDASGYAVGAILAQSDESGEYVIQYASRLLDKYETKYPISLKELTAIMFGIEKFGEFISDVYIYNYNGS